MKHGRIVLAVSLMMVFAMAIPSVASVQTIPEDVPPAPIPVSPANGSVIDTLLPDLEIRFPISGVSLIYNVEWSRDPQFHGYRGSSRCEIVDTSMTRSFQVRENLEPGTVYYWHSNAAYIPDCALDWDKFARWGPWSEPWSFTTRSDGVILPGPQLLSPPDGSRVSELTPTVSWQPVSGGRGYYVYWREFGTTGWRSHGEPYRPTFTSDQLWNIRLGKTYEWWVRAVNDYAYGEDSSHWTFSVGYPVYLPIVQHNQ